MVDGVDDLVQRVLDQMVALAAVHSRQGVGEMHSFYPEGLGHPVRAQVPDHGLEPDVGDAIRTLPAVLPAGPLVGVDGVGDRLVEQVTDDVRPVMVVDYLPEGDVIALRHDRAVGGLVLGADDHGHAQVLGQLDRLIQVGQERGVVVVAVERGRHPVAGDGQVFQKCRDRAAAVPGRRRLGFPAQQRHANLEADRVGVPVVVRMLDLPERLALPRLPFHGGQTGDGESPGHRILR